MTVCENMLQFCVECFYKLYCDVIVNIFQDCIPNTKKLLDELKSLIQQNLSIFKCKTDYLAQVDIMLKQVDKILQPLRNIKHFTSVPVHFLQQCEMEFLFDAFEKYDLKSNEDLTEFHTQIEACWEQIDAEELEQCQNIPEYLKSNYKHMTEIIDYFEKHNLKSYFEIEKLVDAIDNIESTRELLWRITELEELFPRVNKKDTRYEVQIYNLVTDLQKRFHKR